MDYGKIKNVKSKNKVFAFQMQINKEGNAGATHVINRYQQVVRGVSLREGHGEAVSFDNDKARLNGCRELP